MRQQQSYLVQAAGRPHSETGGKQSYGEATAHRPSCKTDFDSEQLLHWKEDTVPREFVDLKTSLLDAVKREDTNVFKS